MGEALKQAEGFKAVPFYCTCRGGGHPPCVLLALVHFPTSFWTFSGLFLLIAASPCARRCLLSCPHFCCPLTSGFLNSILAESISVTSEREENLLAEWQCDGCPSCMSRDGFYMKTQMELKALRIYPVKSPKCNV